MTVRIIVEQTRGLRVLRVEGRLTGAEISELEGALGNDRCGTTLELCELRSADAAAMKALRRLRAEGVTLCNLPPRFAYELDEDG